MQDLYGWTGKIALVNLSDASVQILPTAAYLDRYIGGRGIGARLYYDFVGPDVTAFAPENSLILMTGPLVGSPALACSRIMALFKSPQLFPEQCGIASLGGDLPVQLKSAGYDGLVITGTSRTPCYLIINNETIAVRSAEALWGLDTLTTREKLTAEHGSDVETLCIGPAGEKLIRFSVAVAAKGSAVAHGFGAVMGSKQLKEIAVRGSGKVAVAYPDRLKELNRS
ncbi:MAG: aldehyde ferredoxin oxidoreductase, partial [Deltaproteobacteria bacterium]|nr:aldehyde ferredoxin oxidoreductase [Deltaproteobacteria bacterium]